MTHISDFTFDADGADITPYVDEWRFNHGADPWTNRRRLASPRSRGRMTLENGAGYWTESRLADLSTITVRNDSSVIAVCNVDDYEQIPNDKIAQLRLGAASSDSYDERTGFSAESNLDESGVLSAAGVSLANRSAWAGWIAQTGADYCNDRLRFYRDFGNFADAFIAVDHDGSFVAVLPATEDRAPAFTIRDLTHYFTARNRSVGKQREWRRNSQESHYLTTGLTSASYTIGANTLISSIGTITRTNDRWRVEIDILARQGGNASRFSHMTASASRFQVRIAGDDDFTFLRNDGGRTVGPDSSSGVSRDTVRLVSSPSQEQIDAGNNTGAWQIDDAVTFTLYFYSSTPNENTTRYSHGDRPENALPDMPWAVPNTAAMSTLFESKLARWDSYIPEVTRLVFLTDQPNQSRWNQIRDLRIGDTIALALSQDGMSVSNTSWAMYKSWHYRADAESTVEIRFLDIGQHIAPSETNFLKLGNDFIVIGTDKFVFED